MPVTLEQRFPISKHNYITYISIHYIINSSYSLAHRHQRSTCHLVGKTLCESLIRLRKNSTSWLDTSQWPLLRDRSSSFQHSGVASGVGTPWLEMLVNWIRRNK
jgi:hypothetical protein